MVDAVNQSSANLYCEAKKIGQMDNGRQIYQLSSNEGEHKVSVPQLEADKFEKAVSDITQSAEKFEQSKDSIGKRKMLAYGALIGSGITGILVPALLTKNKALWKKALSIIGGTLAGVTGGFAAFLSILTPPGMTKCLKASKTLSEMDIQPYEDVSAKKQSA